MKTDKIVIVGGGSAGWMAAATLIKTYPDKDITVIESPDISTIGVGESTQGQFVRWTKYIGLDEKDFIPFTDGMYKLSIQFTDFYKKDSGPYHYPFGRPHLEDENDLVFPTWYAMRSFNPELEARSLVDLTFPAQKLWSKNKFFDNEDDSLGNFKPDVDGAVAYQFDATKFAFWLRDRYCLPRGVKHLVSHIEDVPVNDEGVECLVLKNGERVYADLYIDCSGFRSLLLGQALNEPFTSYEDFLPNNSAWACQIPYKDKDKELELFTNCTAIENGWCWNIPLWTRIGTGYNYSDKYVSDEEALEQFKTYLSSDKMVIPRSREEIETYKFRNLKTRIGRHDRIFVKNVMAIGLSAGFIEPLESNGLFSVHEFLFTLIKIMSRGEISEFDRLWCNNEVSDIFDGFAKFVAMHYSMSLRDDTPYWKDTLNRQYSEKIGGGYMDNQLYRAAAYSSAQRKFFDVWEPHYNLFDGVLYITAGMNYKHLVGGDLFDKIHYDPELENKVNFVYDKWKDRAKQWEKAADNAPSTVEYMRNKFYSE